MTTTGVVTTLPYTTLNGSTYSGVAAYDPSGAFWYSSRGQQVAVDGVPILGSNVTTGATIGLNTDAQMRYGPGSVIFESNRILLVDGGNHAVRSGQGIQTLYNPGRQVMEQQAVHLRMLRISTDDELRTPEPQ